MKEWWLNLPLREKQMLSVGSIAVVFFILYQFIWSPLVTLNNDMRDRIQHNRDTLNIMQNIDTSIQQLSKSQENNNHPTGSILGIMQTEMNNSAFASHVTQLRQADNDSVQVNFRKIDFDQMLVFLNTLWKKYHFIVSQITVTPTGAPGEVTVDATIQSSNNDLS